MVCNHRRSVRAAAAMTASWDGDWKGIERGGVCNRDSNSSKVANKPEGPFKPPATSHSTHMHGASRRGLLCHYASPRCITPHSLMAVSFAAARASSIAALSFGSRAYLFVSGANVKFGSRMIDLYNGCQCQHG